MTTFSSDDRSRSPGIAAAVMVAAQVLGLALAVSTAHAQEPPAAAPAIRPSWADPPESVETPPAAAALAPDGLRAAWVTADGRSVLSATRTARSTDWAAPERLFSTRGRVRSLVFSPDGTQLAFENPRTWRGDGTPDDTWSFIAVFDLAGRRLSYVDPSFAMDSRPEWTADGLRISFTRHVDGIPDTVVTRPATRLQTRDWQPPPRRPEEAFTMASVLAAPYLDPPAPSADGLALAYAAREGRARSVYFLRVGQPARRLFRDPEDDGRDLSDVTVSAHGGAVAYVRGGRVNRQGDSPNPTGEPDLPQRQVWIVGTDRDVPRLLGIGSRPLFAPDDRSVLWHAHGSIWAAALVWDGARLTGIGEPHELLHGAHDGLRFSPDGSKVAYERADGIEVLDLDSRRAVAIPHGAHVDLGPVWSPDGRQLAFRRQGADSPALERNLCGGGERYCGPYVASEPWSIWIVDLSSYAARQVWQASPGTGSAFYALDQDYSPGQHGDQLFWSADGRIAFAWEKDGWRHLYAIPASGGSATLLTPGDGEVETAALSADRSRIIYATNISDLGRRHLTSVMFDGGPPREITGGDRSQWAPIPLATGAVAYIEAGWSDPPEVRIRRGDGRITSAGLPRKPAEFPRGRLVRPELVDFPAADGHTAYGQLFVPARPRGCAVVFSHGGIRRQMLPGFHYMDAYHYLYALNQYIAGRGCVVLSVEYRSSIMRGEAFRNAPGWGFTANSEIEDFVGAARYLQTRADVDARRGIGIYGLSWGGYMTAEALALHSDLYTVGFDMAGVHTTADPVGYPNSALAHLATWTAPVYLVQGDDDMNVDFNDGIVLARALQRERPAVELLQEAVPGQTHDLQESFAQMVDIYTKGVDFLLRHLGVP